MALVTVQRSPSPSNSAAESEDASAGGGEEDDVDCGKLSSPTRQRRSEKAKKRLKKFFHTVRFISKLRPFSESYFTVKGAALILPQNEQESPYATKKISQTCHGEIQIHLQSMFYLLRPQDTIKVAVKLESTHPERNRYMAVVSCIGRQDEEESVILGIDCEKTATIGLVYPIYADMDIKLDGDGGFIASSDGKLHIFKPVSVQAMWSALQTLNKVCKAARDNRYIPSGLSHTWIGYYDSESNRSNRSQMSEWYANEDVEFFKSMPIFEETDDEESQFKKKIKVELKNVMMRVDLDEATSKSIRLELEASMNMTLTEYKSFVDQEMLRILGQMDSPTLIKDYLYLGSEWNASNLDELTSNGVGYILNISREIDNFFPGGTIKYQNIREWDCEETDLLKHWENTYKFISTARNQNSKCLVHCKMGISRSASTVMAYLMKEYKMSRQEAYDFVKDKRSCIMPNSAFWKQLETYEGILRAKAKLDIFKSKSQQNLLEEGMDQDTDETDGMESYLGQHPKILKYSQSLPGNLDDSVFLPPIAKDYENYSIEPDMEVESRSADSAEDSLSDHPSPKLEGDTEKGAFCFIGDEDDYQSEELDEIHWNQESAKHEDHQLPVFKIIKSDESWIKDEEKAESAGSETDVKNKHSNDSDEAEMIETDSSEMKKEETVSVESGSAFEHLKEDIPWNPGTVKKTKNNIEEKYKDTNKMTVPTVDSNELKLDLEFLGEKDFSRQDLKLELDGVTLTDSCDSHTDSVSTESEVNKRVTSVYEKEEIPLPPGIVKRTTKEIEERNRNMNWYMVEGKPAIPIQRSSSLKSSRDVPRRRKMDRERRKTCTPILPPSQSPRSPTETFHLDWRRANTGETPRSENETELPNVDAMPEKTNQAVYRLMGEDITMEKGIVQKQKQGIEEKNRVISKSDTKDAKFHPVSQSFGETGKGIPNLQSSATQSAQTSKSALEELSKIPKNQVQKDLDAKVTNSEDDCTMSSEDENSHKQSVSEIKHTFEQTSSGNEASRMDQGPRLGSSPTQREEQSQSHICSFSEKKMNFEKISGATGAPSQGLSTRPKKKSESEARFDPETLELIREIGSALMNSPAKCENEPDESDKSENLSLVRHFVRDIEKRTKIEKHPSRKIIIIDKETQARKPRNWRYSAPTSKTEQSDDLTAGKKTITKSISNPSSLMSDKKVHDSKIEHGQPMEITKENFPNDKVDRANNNDNACISLDKSVIECDNSTPQSAKSGVPNVELSEDHIDKVRNLVGKFELDHQNISPVNISKEPQFKSFSETTHLIKNPVNQDKFDLSGHSAKEEQTTSHEQHDGDIDTVENVQLRSLRENLRKTHPVSPVRPRSAELTHRSNTSPGYSIRTFCERARTRFVHQRPSVGSLDSKFSMEGRKVRKLQGQTHPLTKLEYRRNNPFYNTM